MCEKKQNLDLPSRPFLRWAGGKTKSLSFLVSHLPHDISDIDGYYEPFLGAGSLFFHLQPRRAFLSDLNKDLIQCYSSVKKQPDKISKHLVHHSSQNCIKYYYGMREKYNTTRHSIAKAALFIYLNKTCFNGIWRVNKKNEFNVPYGHKEPPSLPSMEELMGISMILSKTELSHLDYKKAVRNAKKGDFVYFDPPYPPLNGTSYFTHYTKDRFSKDEHLELSRLAKKLSDRGCYILISNADTPFIRSLYEEDFNIFEHKVTRWIRTDGKRYKVGEIVITNYNI